MKTNDILTMAFSFFIGGILLSSIKYSANFLANPELAAFIAAFPLGLFSIFFIKDEQSIDYAINYFQTLIILLMTALCFYLLRKYLNMDKIMAIITSFGFWITLGLIKIYLF